MTDESPAAPAVTAAALRERVAASRERIAEAQQRALRARDELAVARTSATSQDRAVTVTVDAAGTLLDLSFRPGVSALPPARLAQAVLRTYRSATAEAVGRTRAILRDALGADVPALDDIADAVSDGGHA